MTPEEKAAIIEECWQDSSREKPYCFIDDGEHLPKWFWEVHKDGQYWYFETQDMTLEFKGVRIPITTRWILCPEHAGFAQKEDKQAPAYDNSHNANGDYTGGIR